MQVVKFAPGEGFKTVEGKNLELEPINEIKTPNWFKPGAVVAKRSDNLLVPKNLDEVALRGSLTTVDNLMLRIQIEKCKEGGTINCKDKVE